MPEEGELDDKRDGMTESKDAQLFGQEPVRAKQQSSVSATLLVINFLVDCVEQRCCSLCQCEHHYIEYFQLLLVY